MAIQQAGDAYISAFLHSKVYCLKGEYAEAIRLIQRLICTQLAEPDECLENTAPNYVFTASEVPANLTLIHYLKDKASYYAYWDAEDPADKYLTLANQHISLADSLIDRAKLRNNQAGFRRQLDEISLELRKVEMETLYRLYDRKRDVQYFERALNAAERVKHLNISEKLHRSILRSNFGLSDKLVESGRAYADTIARILEILDLPGDLTPEQLSFYEEQYRHFSALRKAHLETLKQDHPEYYLLRFSPPPLELTTLRENVVGSNEALIEYVESDSVVYILAIHREGHLFIRSSLKQPISELVPVLQQQLAQYADSVYIILRQLYVDLIAPIESFIGHRDLVLVPEGNLWYVPFNALLTDSPPPQPISSGQPYLILQRKVRYLFSGRIGLLHQQRQNQSQVKGDGALSISPLNQQGIGGYPRLPNGEKTATLFRQLVGDNHGFFLNDSLATEAIFRQYAPEVQLLHINTHAEINEDHSRGILSSFLHEKS